jgi:shikimate dehydrogenase
MGIDGKTLLSGVMGWPVSHSRSPWLHNHWMHSYGINAVYLPLPVRPDDLAVAIEGVRALRFKGFNVTIPHKQAIIPFLDRLDADAARIGSVNLVTIDERGRTCGFNADAYGFWENLATTAPQGWSLQGKMAVLLGAGGAGRAALAALLGHGAAKVRLLNRDGGKADALASTFADARVQTMPWQHRDDALSGADLLVNATSLGMTGQEPLTIRLDQLPLNALVHDMVYVPLMTPLLAAARQRGHFIVDGLGMLLHQARPAFKAWFGVDPAIDAPLRALVLETL